jgi:peptidoglycan/xylan/chitin deacetylase (PgdA/CDA1 family)
MNLPAAKLYESFQRTLSKVLARRCVELSPKRPVVSFTFDDFPESALRYGGAILEKFSALGTFYISLSLLGRMARVGRIASLAALRETRMRGHELGCHTFSHCHAWQTPAREFEESILDNQDALSQLIPDTEFKTHAYPISSPSPGVKRRAGRRFRCCRAGGQSLNAGHTDLNLLRAYFLEKSRGGLKEVRDLVDRNVRESGWLILSTHDVCEQPSPFGSTPGFLRQVVSYAASSGAEILPVSAALGRICGAETAVPIGLSPRLPRRAPSAVRT